jgi:hypothetical protein
MLHYRSDWRRERKIGIKQKTSPVHSKAAMREFPVLWESRRNDKHNILSETADRRARSSRSVLNRHVVLRGRIELNTGCRAWGCLERHETQKKKKTAGLASEATD